ncbi:MAG: hypothetical protein JW966_00575, partial [Anaerolineae bacterium]|nr:hypothetical protein [Anaerolineae bacterium]
MKTRTWIMLLVLCVMLVLAACGGSDQDSGVALEAVSDDSAAAEQNEAADAALDLAALDGALVYAEGETLYYWPLGRAGAEPEPVASGVDLATVQISPDNTYLLYATAIQENISRRLTTV